ncbi:MAG: TonB-dependent receptor domain-containing protein [Bacteroidales bacterium]
MTIRFYLFTLLLALACLMAEASQFKGTVVESHTGEVLIGATLQIIDSDRGTITGLDGTFNFKDLPVGRYQVICRYIGYEPQTHTFTINANKSAQVYQFRLQEESHSLEGVVITASSDKTSEVSARMLERNSSRVVNAIGAKAIQVSPDLTVANVLQRISGVTVERSASGEGQYAILRGMDKRYNYTTVNGVKIPSPDNKHRYLPLDLFPSELLDRLEVTKSLTADLEGDAIGGAVNMVMKSAPEAFRLEANLSSGYSMLFTERDFKGFDASSIHKSSPYEINGKDYMATSSDFANQRGEYTNRRPMPDLIGGVSVGNRFFDRKLGVILAASYMNTNRGSNSSNYDHTVTGVETTTTLTSLQERQFSENMIRYGIHAKIDYRLAPGHTLSWYNAYLSMDARQTRELKKTNLSNGYNPEQGNANLEFETRTRRTQQNIINSTLQGSHKFLSNSRLTLDWSLAYSKAENERPDQATFSMKGARVNFIETPTYINPQERRWERNDDRDFSASVALGYKLKIADVPFKLQAGALYRNKDRSNFYNNYRLETVNSQPDLWGEDFINYSDIKWKVYNPKGSVATASTYNASEQIAAGYAQMIYSSSWGEINGGVRAENTVQGYELLFPAGELRPEGEQKYLTLLPSIHAKLSMLKNSNFRASYYRSLNRPGFFEIVPYKITNEEYQERGNPDLKSALADNFDFRYEYFPNVTDQYMIGVFYKKIKDPIEYVLQTGDNHGTLYYAPGNFGTANNFGVELDVTKFFRFIGFKANYTYTKSEITTQKMIRVQDGGNMLPSYVDQTRPMAGQSEHVANLSLLLKDTKYGWDAQLAASYTGDRIHTVSQFLNNDVWERGVVQLDASIEKSFHKIGLSIFGKASNLLNSPRELYVKNVNPKNDDAPLSWSRSKSTLIRRDVYNPNLMVGFRYKL